MKLWHRRWHYTKIGSFISRICISGAPVEYARIAKRLSYERAMLYLFQMQYPLQIKCVKFSQFHHESAMVSKYLQFTSSTRGWFSRKVKQLESKSTGRDIHNVILDLRYHTYTSKVQRIWSSPHIWRDR